MEKLLEKILNNCLQHTQFVDEATVCRALSNKLNVNFTVVEKSDCESIIYNEDTNSSVKLCIRKNGSTKTIIGVEVI